jgi:GTPase-activating protein SAC7
MHPRKKNEKFWKSHRRGESRATPTASQTDLHGSVPGGDKSMSSFGSGSGWGGGGRRSLQYDSHQSSDISVPYGADTKEHGEKKSPFDWFQKKRQEHKDRADKKSRTKSPPGSTSDLMSPQGMMRPKDDLAVRGRSMDIPRPTASQDSSDVTPTGTSPNPLAMISPPLKPNVEPTAVPSPPNADVQPSAASASTTPNTPPGAAPATTKPGRNDDAHSHPSNYPLV